MRITNPDLAFQFFKPRLAPMIEEFWVAALDTAKLVTHSNMIFRGTLDAVLFHPRDVFRFACLANAASIIVAHNHPSGDPTPSPVDEIVTNDLLFAAEVMQIPIDDHLILGGDAYFSFGEAGWLDRDRIRSLAN